jgi:hypothetical protein
MLIARKRARRGSVALEAAITLPVLVTLFLGAFDLVGAVTAWRSARTSAIAIAEIATNIAVQNANGTNVITSTQVWDANTAIFAYLSSLKSSTNVNPYAVTLTAVVFAPVTSCTNGSCVCVTTNLTSSATTTAINGSAGSNASTSTACYTANIAWSVPLTNVPNAPNSVTQSRGTNGCGKLTPVVSGTPSSLTTLPQGLYSAYSVVVADVSYTYIPTFTKFVTGSISFLETAYVAPRIGTINGANGAPYVQYSPTNASVVCSGYL